MTRIVDRNMDWYNIKHLVIKAVRQMLLNDHDLLEIEANERTLTHRLAVCLEQELAMVSKEWNVDCEYNRYGKDPKRLVLQPEVTNSADLKGTTVYPDVIIHRRTRTGKENNLLVIEAKKVEQPSSKDDQKLKAFVQAGGGYEYTFGLFLGFTVNGLGRAILYQNGKTPEDSKRHKDLQELVEYSNRSES